MASSGRGDRTVGIDLRSGGAEILPREPAVGPIPTGNFVGYDSDRLHPGSLPSEAVDVLRRISDGVTSEVVDRALADLLGL